MYEKQLLVDGTVKSEDGTAVAVHRAYVAMTSTLLAKKFKSASEVLIPGVGGQVLKALVDYCYYQNLPTTTKAAEKLIEGSVLVGIEPLVSHCQRIIKESLTINSCLRILSLARKLNLDVLEKAARDFVLYNFVQFYQSPSFLEVQVQDLVSILKEDGLNLPSEEEALSAVCRWVQQGDRKKHIPALVGALRTELFRKNFLESFEPVLSGCQDVKKALLKAISAHKREQKRFRLPPEILVNIGGWYQGHATSTVEVYDCRAKTWIRHRDLAEQTSRAYHGLVLLEGLVYVIGGLSDKECLCSCRCFDPVTRVWEDRANMSQDRCYVACAVVGGSIYAMGGFDGVTRTNSVEKYNPIVNQWTEVTSMNNTRSDAGAVAFKGLIYCVGGFTGVNVLDSMEVYDPSSDTWTIATIMETPRSGVSVSTCGQYLWIFGGYNGLVRLRNCERYHPETDSWSRVTPMQVPRSNLTVSFMDGQFYVIGGFNGTRTIDEVECYSLESRAWNEVPKLTVRRSALKSVVIPLRGIPDSKQYITPNNVDPDDSESESSDDEDE